jgi:hypothetical protein
MGDQDGFDELMGRLDHPMVIVTTVAGDIRAGCLVGFHSQCGIEPPLYAVWFSKARTVPGVAAGDGDRDLRWRRCRQAGPASPTFCRKRP